MVTTWEELVAVAREIEEALAAGRAVDPEAAQRLARAVIDLEPPSREPATPPLPPQRSMPFA
jgi:hypothetical protein